MASNNTNQTPDRDLSQQSIDYLALSKQPFSDEILSDKSFFSFLALSKISESLIHQIQFSELLLIIEGPHGSGKTSLYRQFIQSNINNTKIFSIQAEATDTLLQIQQKMLIHIEDLDDSNQLADNLKSLQMFDQVPLIIIDNSHVLSDTTLQELFRYQQQIKQENDITLKILLFANTGMAETMQKVTSIDAEKMYVQTMPEFSPKQVDSFIMHRLQNANYTGEPILSSNEIDKLYKKCDGTPLCILTHTATVIDEIIAKKLKPGLPKSFKVIIFIIILSTLSAAGFGIYHFLYQNNEPNISTPNQAVNEAPAIKPLDVTIEPDVIEILENDYIENTEEEIIPEETGIEETDISQPEAEEQKTEEPEVSTAQIVEPVILPDVSTTENTISKPVAAIETKKASKPQHPAIQQLNIMNLHNAEYLLQQSTSLWTLQLLGAREPETLLKFVQRHNLNANSAWYKTWLKGKAYYVLVYGSFSSRDDARTAISRLPVALRSLKPWVKSMKSIQKSIKH